MGGWLVGWVGGTDLTVIIGLVSVQLDCGTELELSLAILVVYYVALRNLYSTNLSVFNQSY